MDRDPISLTNPPALVRPAEGLSELAAAINAAHTAAEAAVARGLEHARAAGERLLAAKAMCGHGRWTTWVEANLRCSPRSARSYIRIAAGWPKLAGSAVLTVDAALKLLAGEGAAAPAPAPPITVPRAGRVYLHLGSDRDGGDALLEVVARPDKPQFCLEALVLSSGDVLWQGKGRILDGGLEGVLAYHGEAYGFVPRGEWRERPYDPDNLPFSVESELLAMTNAWGNWDWHARRPAEDVAASVARAMALWGVTKRPTQSPGGFYVGCEADNRR